MFPKGKRADSLEVMGSILPLPVANCRVKAPGEIWAPSNDIISSPKVTASTRVTVFGVSSNVPNMLKRPADGRVCTTKTFDQSVKLVTLSNKKNAQDTIMYCVC